jgi:hypothetical protein
MMHLIKSFSLSLFWGTGFRLFEMIRKINWNKILSIIPIFLKSWHESFYLLSNACTDILLPSSLSELFYSTKCIELGFQAISRQLWYKVCYLREIWEMFNLGPDKLYRKIPWDFLIHTWSSRSEIIWFNLIRIRLNVILKKKNLSKFKKQDLNSAISAVRLDEVLFEMLVIFNLVWANLWQKRSFSFSSLESCSEKLFQAVITTNKTFQSFRLKIKTFKNVFSQTSFWCENYS